MIDALVSAANAQVDPAVANGKMDEARAATIKGKIPTIAEKLVNRTSGQQPRRNHGRIRTAGISLPAPKSRQKSAPEATRLPVFTSAAGRR